MRAIQIANRQYCQDLWLTLAGVIAIFLMGTTVITSAETTMAKSTKKNPRSPPRVALLAEMGAGSGRDILCGIARYLRESGPWALHHEPRMLQFVEGWAPKWLENWQGDGIIGRFRTKSIIEAVKHAGVPAVDVLGSGSNCPFPLVQPDNSAVGRMAAEHLIERGFHQFAFVGPPSVPWADQRREAFQAAVSQHGFECSELPLHFDDLQESWDDFVDQTAEWLRQHRSPLGLMVCWDTMGPPVTQACRQAGLAVPEEVAIVGVDNDAPICSICDPPLTSICPNHNEVGYQAAALLDRMMAGESAPKARIFVPPRTIVVRQSSDVSAIEDPIITMALRMIREHACNGLQVSEIAEQMPVSRSVLQRRFQAVMGRSVHDEIFRVQMRKAEELLRETDLPIGVIAKKAGFNHQEYMGAVFKSHAGMTPREFRRQSQKDSSGLVSSRAGGRARKSAVESDSSQL
jgi:LacI family transcriptional regulator